MKDSTFDVGEFINRRPVGGYQIVVMLLCAMIMFADGYDVLVMGFLVPTLAKAFRVAPAALTFVFLMQAVGLTLGTYIIGPVADRVGRRRVLIISAVLFGLTTLAAVLATSVFQLGMLRFVAGLFFSAAIPNAIALTSEFSPNRLRGTLINLMFVGYVAGAASGGAIATFLVRGYGWQSAFWVGGLVPIAMAGLLWALLPESIRYCVNRDGRDPRIPGLLCKIDKSLKLDGSERFVLGEPAATGVAVAALFRDGRAAHTLLLWLGYLANLLVISVMGSFFLTYIRNFSGMSLERAAGIASFYSIAGIVAMLFFGSFIDRFGAPRLLAVTYFGAAVALTSLGVMNLLSGWVYFAVFWVGVCVLGGQGGLHALSASLYPTKVRATGVAWAFGLGGVGRFVGPAIGGVVLHEHWSSLPAFVVPFAVPMLIASVAMLVMALLGIPKGDEKASAAGAH